LKNMAINMPISWPSFAIRMWLPIVQSSHFIPMYPPPRLRSSGRVCVVLGRTCHRVPGVPGPCSPAMGDGRGYLHFCGQRMGPWGETCAKRREF
jgi:hypothetical protein